MGSLNCPNFEYWWGCLKEGRVSANAMNHIAMRDNISQRNPAVKRVIRYDFLGDMPR
jgi:hypothetical protein